MSDRKKELEECSGHRQRLIEKFHLCGQSDCECLFDYELLELLLYFVNARKDTRNIGKLLLNRFGSLENTFSAKPSDLLAIPGVGDRTVLLFNLLYQIFFRLQRKKLDTSTKIISLENVIKYCSVRMQTLINEELRAFFLNKGNQLIADEIIQKGTVDTVPFIERTIIERAIHFGATAIILVHNHPSGEVTPSARDILCTQNIIEIAEKLNIKVLDHIIIGPYNYFSMKEHNIIS